ncbi:hypothetical protein Pcinc_024156 [Petrolisthes cinctipes]|uniref:Uncharacterized protein n=1 Tax=Petrolisthes cinctipes TaxID=88211 RepID=A0AAE1FB47_PETCI|nr:hypothetical protein Pcinc_024156 [Petrolisthes cinctipes]
MNSPPCYLLHSSSFLFSFHSTSLLLTTFTHRLSTSRSTTPLPFLLPLLHLPLLHLPPLLLLPLHLPPLLLPPLFLPLHLPPFNHQHSTVDHSTPTHSTVLHSISRMTQGRPSGGHDR